MMQLEVGMGRANTRVGPAQLDPIRGSARSIFRYMGRGLVMIKKFYFRPTPT